MILSRIFGVSKLTANFSEIPKPLTGFLYSNNHIPTFQGGDFFGPYPLPVFIFLDLRA
jgi:hypothetical protein